MALMKAGGIIGGPAHPGGDKLFLRLEGVHAARAEEDEGKNNVDNPECNGHVFATFLC